MKAAALCNGHLYHYLDHLAPLCDLMQIPLLTSDTKIETLAKRYYPMVETRYIHSAQMSPYYLGTNFDTLFVTEKHLRKKLQPLIEATCQKQVTFCYLPHGNSDKGLKNPAHNPFPHQEMALIYGAQMEERFCQTLNSKRIGNFRYDFYKRYQNFYDNLIDEELCLPQKKIYLYAPTWDDQENGTTLFQSKQLLKNIPSDTHLIIKAHPLLYETHLAEMTQITNSSFLEDFPLIYPLLARCDAYIGDYSSIGYDFLTFDRPLFFLGNKQTDLRACGLSLPEDPYPFITENSSAPLSEKRKKLYTHAFGLK